MKRLLKKTIKKFLAIKFVNVLAIQLRLLFCKPSLRTIVKFLEKKVRIQKDSTHNNIILMDFFAVEETMIAYSFFSNILAKKQKAKLVTFAYHDNILPYWGQTIYRAFGCSEIIRIYLKNKEKILLEEAISLARKTIVTKEDLLEFKIFDMDIGIDIYESVLRDFNVPTVDMNDNRVWQQISSGLELCIFWRKFFSENNVTAVILSHDTYMWMNIIAKVAYKNKTPVYLPSCRFIVKTGRAFQTYEFLRNYKKWFSSLTIEEQLEGRAWGEKQLKARLSGQATTELYYSNRSAYSSESKSSCLKKNNKLKVLIASHCFYDNPHAFAKMGFTDFLDWLNFLGQKSLETDYDWYIKVHPDPLPGTIEIVKSVLVQYPNITMVPYEISHQQLINEGIRWVITCFGTIGEEYPLLGAGVINCAYNPRIAYDFNLHCSSRDELDKCLNSLYDPSFETVNLDEVYEFVFCHHKLRYCDDLIFPSYQNFLQYMMTTKSDEVDVFSYYLSVINDDQICNTEQKIENYISSVALYLTEKGPTNIFVESEY